VTGVALYLRVSTEDQDLAGQERELRTYAASRGWAVTATYAEKVSASGRVERAAFEELRSAALKLEAPLRPFDRVLVWSLDRWSREPSFVRAIGSIEELERLGVSWHSFREPTLDSSEDGSANLARDILRGILPTIAAFEARRRSERTSVAMRELREGRRKTRSGNPVGRPRRLEEATIRRVVAGRKAGEPYSRLAQQVGLPIGTCRYAFWLGTRGPRALTNPSVEKGKEPESSSTR
jgi:DNA invertase Pin-like site-specific DNA recombinase